MNKQIKKDMTDGVVAFNLLSHFVRSEELQELVITVQKNVLKNLKRGRKHRSI